MPGRLQQVGFTSGPYAAEEMEIERRRRMAEALQARGTEGLGNTEVVGGWAIPKSPWEGVGRMAQQVSGAYQDRRAAEMARALRERQQGDRSADMTVLASMLKGAPATSEQIMDEQAAGGEGQMATINAPARPGGIDPAMLGQLRTPQMQDLAMQMYIKQIQPKDPNALLGKINPKDYTPESFAQFMQTQNPAVLRAVQDYVTVGGNLVPKPVGQPPQGGIVPVYTAPEKPDRDAGAWGEPYSMNGAMVQKNSRTGEIRTAVSRPPVTNVTTSITQPGKIFENENKLRDDYTTASKPFVGIRDAYNTIKASLDGPITAVSTLAGATKFMKMIDPESVVRESELNMALRASGMLDRFMNLHNTVLKGQVLTPTQTQEIKNIAEALYKAAQKQQKRTDDYFGRLATEYGLKPDRVIRDQSAAMRVDPQDAAALEWANANPNDPRAAAIKQKLGAR